MLLRVWIDQSICQNSGLCEESVPRLFKIGTDFFAYVRSGDRVLDNPGGEEGKAEIPADLEDDALTAARECPSQCIHILK